jgi:hypothetical protein
VFITLRRVILPWDAGAATYLPKQKSLDMIAAPAPAGDQKLTSSTTVPVRAIGWPHFGMPAAILLGAALAIAPTLVLAEIQVRGSPDAVRIEARDTPVEEILAALNRAFGMHYQLSANLDKRLSGTYVGSLRRVLTRILDGYNFVLKTDNGTIAVTVLGTPNASAAVPVSSGPKVVGQPAASAPAAELPYVVDDRARPTVAASTAAPSPAITEPPPFPTPALPTSGSALAPVPELGQSAAPAPAPPALGAKAIPAPEPRPFAGIPPQPAAGPTPLSVQRRAQ